MTKSEALSVLKNAAFLGTEEDAAKVTEAIDTIEGNVHDSGKDADCISRQAAIDAIGKLYAIHGSEGSWIDQKDAYMAIDSLPAVDAVPVVRCGDCKRVYCRTYQDWQEPIYTCTHFRNKWNTDFDMEVNPDDYCSYAKRRTNGTAD